MTTLSAHCRNAAVGTYFGYLFVDVLVGVLIDRCFYFRQLLSTARGLVMWASLAKGERCVDMVGCDRLAGWLQV